MATQSLTKCLHCICVTYPPPLFYQSHSIPRNTTVISTFQNLLLFLTKILPTQEGEKLLHREYFIFHKTAIKKLARGGELWLANERDADICKLLVYFKQNYLSLPSNNQCVETGEKDATLCQKSGQSERITLLLIFFDQMPQVMPL